MSAGLMMIRGPLVFAAAWGLMELLRQGLHLGTGWPLWTIALITTVAIECIILLYRYEQGAVGRAKAVGLPPCGSWLWSLSSGCSSSRCSVAR